MALHQELLEDLVDGVGFVRPVVADGPVAVVLVLVDHEPVPGLIDAEGPGLLPVFPNEEAHPKQRHAPLGAVLLQLSDGPGMLDAPGRVLDIVGVLRPAVGAELLIGAQRAPAIGAGARGRRLIRPTVRSRPADRHHVQGVVGSALGTLPAGGGDRRAAVGADAGGRHSFSPLPMLYRFPHDGGHVGGVEAQSFLEIGELPHLAEPVLRPYGPHGHGVVGQGLQHGGTEAADDVVVLRRE